MLLSSAEIRNFRSLEHVTIDGLDQFNVFIGRNNVGKSTILKALQHLAVTVFHAGPTDVSTSSLSNLTAHDHNRVLQYYLVFKPSPEERERFVESMITAGYQERRRDDLLRSSFLREVGYRFVAPSGEPSKLRLAKINVLTEDNQWATTLIIDEVQRSHGSRETLTTRSVFESGDPIEELVRLSHAAIDVSGSPVNVGGRAYHQNPSPSEAAMEEINEWLRPQLREYFASAYFFNPFRHISPRSYAARRTQLAPDGHDLAVVLNTLSGGARATFQRIESFLMAAVPEAGTLHPQLVATDSPGPDPAPVEIAFHEASGYETKLADMGGGIEQLLMVATALETAGERATLFLEEPELHLHPGAQRYLAERLLSDTRQVFVTTHSSIFVNLEPPHSLYRVQAISGLTQVQRVEGSTDLAVLMEDIGARNSDLLLSDAVLFVEGMSDREILHFWFHTLGQGLIEGNITVLATGGGRGAERQAVARSSVLVEISRRAPVPHLFLIDRDERRHGDVGRLQQQLEARIHVLKRREIENYLLVPRAIIAAMLRKYEHDADVFAKVQATTEEEVQQLISEGANQLHDLVLLKRVKAEIGGLADGLLPTNMINELIRRAHDHDLANHLHEAIRKRVDDELTRLNLDAIVLRERNTLDEAWGETESILSLAPGSEILEYVFASYGGRFKKASDGPRIAQAMKTEEIDEEIRELLGRISRLAPSKMSGDPQNDH